MDLQKSIQLGEAASAGDYEQVMTLLQDPTVDVHHDEDYALRIACGKNRIEIVKALLSAGADYTARDNTPLMVSAAFGLSELVKVLLDAGANNPTGLNIALTYAAERQHCDTVALLLDAGADVHAYDDRPLFYAVENDDIEMIKLLLDAGADPVKPAIMMAATGSNEIIGLIGRAIGNKN